MSGELADNTRRSSPRRLAAREQIPQEHLRTGFQRSSAPHWRCDARGGREALRRHDSSSSVSACAQRPRRLAGNTKVRALCKSFASH
ncbi:hypothetical protein AC233_00665 [Burkholderia sp. HB1]|nr:hypothetical protein AC233_00665 [Burkholderia sp. HB1]